MSGFYMHLTSDDSDDLFSSNSYLDFTIQTPSYINLPSQYGGFDFLSREWTVALVDFTLYSEDGQRINQVPTDFVVLCSLCGHSYIKGRNAPVIRIFQLDANSTLSVSDNSSHYISLQSAAHSFNQLRIYIRDLNLEEVDKEKWPQKAKVSCSLHFTHV